MVISPFQQRGGFDRRASPKKAMMERDYRKLGHIAWKAWSRKCSWQDAAKAVCDAIQKEAPTSNATDISTPAAATSEIQNSTSVPVKSQASDL